MRMIKGILCIAVVGKTEVLFGKNTGGGQDHYENFRSNDLTPFADISVAQIAKTELQKRFDFDAVKLAWIHICLAETMNEIDSLRNRKSLIVVRKTPEIKDMLLIGRPSYDAPSRYPLYGALLSENGMRPFPNFSSLEYTASEEHRQSSCPVLIATFKIKKL